MDTSPPYRPGRSVARLGLKTKGAVWAMVLSVIALICITVLEARFSGLDVTEIEVEETPVTLYQLPTGSPKPLSFWSMAMPDRAR